MASPTEAELNTQLQNAVAVLDNLLVNQTVVTDEDTYVQSLESDFAASQAQGARLFRSRVAAAVASGSAILGPVLTAYAHHVVGTPERSAQSALDRIYDYFKSNNHSVKSRGITYGSVSSFGSNKGLFYRVSVDENGYDLEATFLDKKTFLCIRDENTGADRHAEVFELRGANAGVDALTATGSGAVRRNLVAKTHADSLLKNAGFTQTSIAGTLSAGGTYALVSGDSLTGWTVTTAVTNLTLDASDVPITSGIVGESIPRSVLIETNETLTQAFSVNGIQLNASNPYILELWVKPTTSTSAGSITITWGSKSQAFTLTGLTVGSWNRVIIDQDKDTWPASFNVADATVAIAISSYAGGTGVKIYGVNFTAMEAFDGLWYHGSAGTTKFVLDDTASVSDALAGSDSKIQKWLWRVYARHLPHRAAATQVVASARNFTFNDNGGSADTITTGSGDFAADGYYVGMTLTVAGTASNDGTYTLTAVAATTLTVATGSFAAEGPLSSTETLDAASSLGDPA